ncbi:hypothetical protein NL676_014530 [Syzygium grande]|nr:hypothetical protein NL676_014530 [Syzygium grande]
MRDNWTWNPHVARAARDVGSVKSAHRVTLKSQSPTARSRAKQRQPLLHVASLCTVDGFSSLDPARSSAERAPHENWLEAAGCEDRGRSSAWLRFVGRGIRLLRLEFLEAVSNGKERAARSAQWIRGASIGLCHDGCARMAGQESQQKFTFSGGFGGEIAWGLPGASVYPQFHTAEADALIRVSLASCQCTRALKANWLPVHEGCHSAKPWSKAMPNCCAPPCRIKHCQRSRKFECGFPKNILG